MSQRRIVITSASEFIGSNLLDKFIKAVIQL
jgi:nucleoside-diphosphate-sugar epimerase